MVVTMKDAIFWDFMPCGSCKNRRFGYVPVKCHFLQEPHDVTSQKMGVLIIHLTSS
jgi:hypothetical protein